MVEDRLKPGAVGVGVVGVGEGVEVGRGGLEEGGVEGGIGVGTGVGFEVGGAVEDPPRSAKLMLFAAISPA